LSLSLPESWFEKAWESGATSTKEAGKTRSQRLDRKLGGLLQGQRVRGRSDGDAGHQPAGGKRLRGRKFDERHQNWKFRHLIRW